LYSDSEPWLPALFSIVATIQRFEVRNAGHLFQVGLKL